MDEGGQPVLSPHPEFYFQHDADVREDNGRRGHMFQQSVTLTAKMWYESNGTHAVGSADWWRSWSKIPTEYLPVLVGLCCGIAIVLFALSALIVWRCCILPRRKQDFCDGSYCDMSSQATVDGSKQAPRDTAVYALRNGPWGYHSRVLSSNESLYAVPRSCTMSSVPMRHCSLHDYSKNGRPASQSVTKEVTMIIPPISPEFDVPSCHLTQSSSTDANIDEPMDYFEKSKSTPALEDLYAKVNFSKKKKNRMRKDEAAIIALSKSRTELESDSLPATGNAVVVYNERTAL